MACSAGVHLQTMQQNLENGFTLGGKRVYELYSGQTECKKKRKGFQCPSGSTEDVQQEVLIDGKVIVPCLRVYLGAKGLAGPRSFFY